MDKSFVGNGKTIVFKEAENTIYIGRSGAMGAIDHSPESTIPLHTLQTIVYRRGSIFANGIIQFGTLGGQSDINTVFFFPGKNDEALEFKNYVEKKLREYQERPQGQSVVQQISQADELKKFKELLDAGVITQEEFEKKKQQILES
ncbi:SHOCT domain-containing protein [Butyrivibrio sp. AE2032]|uniref:SHOCT domain-containing protein n=1 Tax=Butyrivibrio sp. AE2032 TaxID=1458463 RepID=UPI0005563EC2|nr:SHOCT domain-containing protein [Butyrivibrio sp. AE2032]